MLKKIKILLVTCLPHHFLSKIMYKITRSEKTPFLRRIKAWYAKHFEVKLNEAEEENLDAYPTMNQFFTRALKPEARQFDLSESKLCCPVDGAISQFGNIDNDQIFQAKKHNYSLFQLMGGLDRAAKPFINGKFITIYLSPKDYHRIHMPYSGKLTEMIHVPGRLFSVAPDYVENVPGLFARNERVISIFETSMGPVAMILVGAIFVSSMETVWSGVVTPPNGKRVVATDYSRGKNSILLDKGAEMGRFNMGSTIVMLFGNQTMQWSNDLVPHQPIEMGKILATV